MFTHGAIPDVSDAIKKLIVPLDKLVQYEKNLQDPDSLESLYYKQIQQGDI